MYRGNTRRLMRSFLRADEGNWRLKALMLAAFDDPVAVAEAWPKNDRHLSPEAREHPITMMDSEYDVVVPELLPEDTSERSLARSEFSEQEFGDYIPRDVYIPRMLGSGRFSGEELDVLWREELLNSVIMGAEPVKVARNAATVMNVGKSDGDIPRGAAQIYAPIIAEGAEIPMDAETYDTVSFNTEKIAQGFAISEKLIANSEPDVLERQVRFAGAAVENTINRMWISEVIDNAGQEVDTTHSATTKNIVQAINEASGEVEGANFGATDSLLQHSAFKTELFSDSNLIYANRSGSDSVLKNRVFNDILGMTLYTGANGAAGPSVEPASTQSWGWSSDGDIGGVAYRKDFTGVVMWKDMEMKDFDDPVRDLVGGNVRSYADAVTMQPDALCRLEY